MIDCLFLLTPSTKIQSKIRSNRLVCFNRMLQVHKNNTQNHMCSLEICDVDGQQNRQCIFVAGQQ